MAARWRNSDRRRIHLVDGRYWTPGDYASGATADYNNSSATVMVAWCRYNSGNTTHFVGEKMPNHLGFYDMSGNVWESTFTSSGSYRIMRGGSYYYVDYDDFLLVGNKGNNFPYSANSNLGFRMVRTP